MSEYRIDFIIFQEIIKRSPASLFLAFWARSIICRDVIGGDAAKIGTAQGCANIVLISRDNVR